MSETLHTPWIADYLISLAETCGGSLGSAPMYTKSKKVQLVEFLTFQQHDEDDCIWAVVSDKWQKLPVRFTSQALSDYSMN
ncbi:hypothetical protein FA95DRAFT_81453 [Auriscalpium vulgare]|uniref:Uncharacterized protein n=1 Tax=Auriscalpium vulgare TaxID=40419 RepID=A0ACB8RP16_9AGAM|nr:hypothetical protein FA95DRAFT_81453 [Auriscalpium vulgare]